MSNALKLLQKSKDQDDGDLIIDDKQSSDLPFGLEKLLTLLWILLSEPKKHLLVRISK